MKSTARIVLGVILAAVGIAVAVMPQYTHCTQMGTKIPGCLDSVTAELILGIILAVVGVAIAVLASRIAGVVLSAVALVLSVLVIVFPVSITGTCKVATMLCNTTMKPWAIILGAVGIALSFALLLMTVVKPRRGQAA